MIDHKQDETALVPVKAEINSLVATAHSLVVSTKSDADAVIGFRAKIKARIKWAKEYWDGPAGLVTINRKAYESARGKRDEMIDPLTEADAIAEKKARDWQLEENRKAAAEQARLQAIEAERARKEREKAEAAARIQREKEAQAQRDADEARRKAQEATDAKERDRLNREAEARQKIANAAAAAAAAKEEKAAMVEETPVHVPAQQMEGAGLRKTYKARLVDKAALIIAASGDLNGLAASMLAYNEKAGNDFARSSKGAVKIPGIVFEEVYGSAMDRSK